MVLAWVAEHGPGNWHELANSRLPKRNGKSCRLRWVGGWQVGHNDCVQES